MMKKQNWIMSGWVYFTINSKKVVFSYVQVNTHKENAQTEKK
jgi:hypothetical protein